MARYLAKKLVAAGVADRCELQLAYAIGIAEPISIMVNTHGTGRVSEAAIVKGIRELFDLTPAGIIKTLKLRRPIYLKTAAYGHFGRDEEGFSWEELDRVNDIKRAFRVASASSKRAGVSPAHGNGAGGRLAHRLQQED